ncbi:class I SAM-dependent methyltransferase [Paenibacillus lemnae]|uniref:Class I SAM-dependent methyltransferase n=1 Tax=Paenibacillus lemnae TaxID=1330551 RepID=A0A848M8L5_PAELE|nr:methyltransferase domain-containing protein [Paenibacillus lemnae]NMO96551.1 class I SAM-dependent methyltransferase [Paenibacillus lemnae]
MGTSNWQNISFCVEQIRMISPNRVLDIGVGFGRWGMLCREFLEVWNGRVFRKQWRVRIEGVEIFPKNVDPYHAYFYNQIHIGDAYDFVHAADPQQYDLIILGDVLEHFDKVRAVSLLNACLMKGRFVMLNIPIGSNWPQGTVYGNAHETHRSTWTTQELDQYPVKAKQHFKDYINRDFSTYVYSRY